MAGVIVEVESKGQHRSAFKSDGLLQIEDGRVILAKLRVDRPRRVLVTIDGRLDRQAALLKTGTRADDCHGLSWSTFEWGSRNLEIAEGKIAIACSTGPAAYQRR